MPGKTATAQTETAASREQVWAALTEPDAIEKWMAGSTVATTWEVGAPITWSGEYDGKSYQDKGEVLIYDEPSKLSVTHYSPLMGDDDVPENYHTLTESSDGGTQLELTQDGCDNDEQAEQFSQNWQQMLDGIKAQVEG